jgi:hypothetical protein
MSILSMQESVQNRLDKFVDDGLSRYRVDIEGDPDIHCAMTMGAARGHGAGHAAMAATAMRVVNAIPYVVDSRPGLLSSLDIPTTLPQHVFD